MKDCGPQYKYLHGHRTDKKKNYTQKHTLAVGVINYIHILVWQMFRKGKY